eukprot:CAMPEP_0181476022 /NCGR_PEP_ID=MMETSP1110-20121109/41493_1 /TAXON_ID=174948 /ORGANISM="Symbiodinium sp., Strain CCMP421" /LENGTH=496 /DNA_ID=CAMNT_0023601293 /DNA_START=38 /DNA_END=1528 /DNA_ORIENTATION=+
MSAINEIQQKLMTQLDMKLEDLKPEQVARLVAAEVLTEREAALVQIRLETAKPMQAPEFREVTDHGYAPTLLQQSFSGTAPVLQTGKDTNAGVMKLGQVDWQQVFANCNLTYGRITSSSAFGCSSKPLFKEPTGADIKQAFRPAQVSEQELAVVLFSDKFKAHSELCSAQAYQEVCTPLAAAAAEYKSASHQEQREVGTQYSVVHKYQVPAGSFKIDTEHLELNPGFVKSVEEALSAAGNCLPEELSKFFEDRIFSTYGDVYPTEVMIGVAAFSTEVKNVTKQESKKQAADSAHVAASGIGQGVAGKGDVAAGTEMASAEGAHAVNESRSWTSIGAAISDGKNPRSITSSREDSSAWRCIQYEKVASVFDFLPKNLLARVRELEQKLESQKKQLPALPPSEDLERRRLAVAAVIKGLQRLDRWQHTMYQRNEAQRLLAEVHIRQKRLETGESLLDDAEHKQIKWLVGLYSGFIWNVDDNKTSAAAQRSADVLANGR